MEKIGQTKFVNGKQFSLITEASHYRIVVSPIFEHFYGDVEEDMFIEKCFDIFAGFTP
jgi:hypothetical protein